MKIPGPVATVPYPSRNYGIPIRAAPATITFDNRRAPISFRLRNDYDACTIHKGKQMRRRSAKTVKDTIGHRQAVVVRREADNPLWTKEHDGERWNPEDLFVAALSACHKLWYLHFCAVSGVVVTGYEDHAEGTMEMDEDGAGRFTEVVLKPRVTITERSDVGIAEELHGDAHEKCFIANSVNFPVRCEPTIIRA